ncbi:PAS domain S-box protein [Pseudooceanicola sediminis]|uniref:PAS domain S-box protein n=1 Tax=Pseudooceanicola sediminis TaxID=2211117 RepID=A0A399J1Z7_9RHOB|nr:methyl-accepting chemotaxis protein [Pseudooceanicola sediminis]KAA2316337.1 PAS domain S-box protein [Puniceibacterium sp. HSS470]RII39251.1 PAS domain S-box protein [Pseudooceanicola sediminis]|tara:strand:+ start:19210 stop:21771 length:2562 start_codon:yes stop_codon:yes gene_type:complete
MTTPDTEIRAIPVFKSTLFRATLIVALCILMVVTASELIALRKERNLIETWIGIRAAEATSGVGAQVSGALKFSRPEAVEDVVSGFARGIPDDLVGVSAIQPDGTVLYDMKRPGYDAETAKRLAERAISTEQPQIDTDLRIWAYPSRFGKDAVVVGAFVTQWSSEKRIAAAMAEHIYATAIAGLLFVLSLLLCATLFYRYISRPLGRVAAQMGLVGRGHYDIAIECTGRADEIGGIAKRLDDFRVGLQAARATQRENAFKSAAIDSTGAAMMLLDADMKIVFCNPACDLLLDGAGPAIRAVWPDFSAGKLEGQGAAQLPELASFVDLVRAPHADLPKNTEVKWGEASIRVAADSVRDLGGDVIGFVMELEDISQEKLNQAVLSAIDTHQVRIDFDNHQNVVGCNPRICELAGMSEEEFCRRNTPSTLSRGDEATMDLAQSIATLREGKPVSGKFRLPGAGNADLFLEGSLSPILSRDGEMQRVVFIGSDITEAHKAMRAAEEDRLETSRQQQLVVDTLKVGLRQMAQGDLTCQIHQEFRAEYEQLRSNFNQAVESLHDAMCAVIQNAESIRGETGEISNAADDLAKRTEKQAATLEETAAALDQLTASVKSAAIGADEASKLAGGAQAKAEMGGQVARDAITAMDAIKVSSQEISKITGVIDDIAFQTNLLALNAGVEAARAGDAGRGFAVVATEVRALAQRSSDAAREINQLISASGNHVKSGVDLVDKTGEALGDIVTSVADISTRVATIASSAREQSLGLNEINNAMNDLDQVTQQNSAMFEETTAASHALTSEANSLVEAAEKFKVKVTGKSKTGGRTNVQKPKSRRAAVAGQPSARAAAGVPESWEEF